MYAFAVWARMTMQADAAIRLEDAAENHHSDDAVNRSQRVQKVGEVKHSYRLSVDKYPLLCLLGL